MDKVIWDGAKLLSPTSIITIPNANTSDSLLWRPTLFKISGEVYRGVLACSLVVLSSEFVSRATIARPKSTSRAFPSASTSTFACADHHQHGFENISNSTYSFDVSVNQMARVKVIETFCNAKQLRAG